MGYGTRYGSQHLLLYIVELEHRGYEGISKEIAALCYHMASLSDAEQLATWRHIRGCGDIMIR